jgi:biopolymer transport protein ExbB
MRIFEFLSQGGVIMYILLVLNVIGIALIITKFVLFKREGQSVDLTIEKMKQTIKNENSTADMSTMIELSKREISVYMAKLEKGLNTIKIIASISPLLGLLGTVTGVLMAFRIISQTGATNPADFAGGIAMALVTTIGGLIVAIPNFVGHNYLLGGLDRLEVTIEKKLLSKIL